MAGYLVNAAVPGINAGLRKGEQDREVLRVRASTHPTLVFEKVWNMTDSVVRSDGRFAGLVEFSPQFRPRPEISHVLFDFDGTLSLIRQGWPEVMVPMFVEMLPRCAARGRRSAPPGPRRHHAA